MLDEAMLDTRKFWFDEPADQFQEWKPVLHEYQTAHSVALNRSSTETRFPPYTARNQRLCPLALMVFHTPLGDYPLKTAIQS